MTFVGLNNDFEDCITSKEKATKAKIKTQYYIKLKILYTAKETTNRIKRTSQRIGESMFKP